MALITTSGITQAAVEYQNKLRYFFYLVLMERVAALNWNVQEVDKKDVASYFIRKGGLIRPYLPGSLGKLANLGEFKESPLIVEKSYGQFDDNVQNYVDKKVISAAGTAGNQQKKHPLERLILEQGTRTVGEEVLSAIYHGVRDTADQTWQGTVTGYHKIISAAIVSGEIATGNGNYKATGAIAAPATGTDTDAYDKVVDFLSAAHFSLKNQRVILEMSNNTYKYARQALRNKFAGKILKPDLLEELRDDCRMPFLEISTSVEYGEGNRLVLSLPGLRDLGVNSRGDFTFVQVRQIDADPNIINFWWQYDSGVRILTLNKKAFLTNDGTITGTAIVGD